MEGPFISPSKIGAQNPKYVMGADARDVPPPASAQRRADQAGGPGAGGSGRALDFIRACGGEVRVSIAHTCTDYDTAKAAFAAGARHMTHLLQRDAGHHPPRAGARLWPRWRKAPRWELITDGVHIHPAMVRFHLPRVLATTMWVLIADSMEGRGPCRTGSTAWAAQAVTVRGPARDADRTPRYDRGQRDLPVRLHAHRRAGTWACRWESAVRGRQREPGPLHWHRPPTMAAWPWGAMATWCWRTRGLGIRTVIKKGEALPQA